MFTEAHLDALYRRQRKRLYNAVYRYVWNAADADEIVQEAFVKLWKVRADVVEGTVDGLIWRIALNLATNRHNRKKRWSFTNLDKLVSGRDPEVDVGKRALNKEVRRAIDALDDELRAVMLMTEFSQLSQREVADVLDIAEGTVASRRHRAREQLKKRLARLHEEA